MRHCLRVTNSFCCSYFFFFQAEDGIRDSSVTGVQTCALPIFAIATELGFDPSQVAAALAGYRGAMRRMELKGEVQGVRVVDSYAHHPTELSADLAAARDIAAGGRVIAIFQPHLFSRTRIFAEQFADSLS